MADIGDVLEKNCKNCAHSDLGFSEIPCAICVDPRDSVRDYSQWVPLIIQKPGPKAGHAKIEVRAPDILSAAEKHMRDRAATYDKPEGERSMAQTVAVFNTFHGTSLTEAQGWHFQQILKDVRLFTRAGYHADSAEDCVAYAGLKAEAKAKE